MSNFSMKGVVQSLSPVQQAGNFQWRELNLEVTKQVGDKEYTDVFQFQISGKNLDTVSETCVNCEAEISFNIRSREYKGKYYTSLNMWKMTYDPKYKEDGSNEEAQAVGAEVSDDDLPF